MIPRNSGLLQQDFVISEQPTFTYMMDMEKMYIRGNTDKLRAMEQAVYKIVASFRVVTVFVDILMQRAVNF